MVDDNAASNTNAHPSGHGRAYGRSLTDFPDSSEAEKQLIDCCRRGVVCTLGDGMLPTEDRIERRVDARLVRFLALGGDSATPVHEKGVCLEGAWLDRPLDLGDCDVVRPVIIRRSRIEEIDADDANLRGLSLEGTFLEKGLAGDRLKCQGSFMLNVNFRTTGLVSLNDAEIGGNLYCTGGRFNNAGRYAVSGVGLKVRGSLSFDSEFEATSEVCLIGAEIKGNLVCTGGKFNKPAEEKPKDGATKQVKPEGMALDGGGIKVDGEVYLNEKFAANGAVSLIGAKIGGDFNCEKGSFKNAGGTALTCDRTRVEGGFFFRQVVAVEGTIELPGMYAHILLDDIKSWQLTESGVRLALDGFTYDRIAEAPTDAKTRIQWLMRQLPEHLDQDFRPQPWEQLITVLRAMGHPNQADEVAMAKEDQLALADKIKGIRMGFHRVYKHLAGYGYRPGRTLNLVPVVWLVGVLLYWSASFPGIPAGRGDQYLLMPTREQSSGNCSVISGAPTAIVRCPTRSRPHEPFFAPVYSLDVLLPIINLGYKSEWQPTVIDENGNMLLLGWVVQVFYWFEIIFGWLASLVLVGLLGTLVKKK